MKTKLKRGHIIRWKGEKTIGLVVANDDMPDVQYPWVVAPLNLPDYEERLFTRQVDVNSGEVEIIGHVSLKELAKGNKRR